MGNCVQCQRICGICLGRIDHHSLIGYGHIVHIHLVLDDRCGYMKFFLSSQILVLCILCQLLQLYIVDFLCCVQKLRCVPAVAAEGIVQRLQCCAQLLHHQDQHIHQFLLICHQSNAVFQVLQALCHFTEHGQVLAIEQLDLLLSIQYIADVGLYLCHSSLCICKGITGIVQGLKCINGIYQAVRCIFKGLYCINDIGNRINNLV